MKYPTKREAYQTEIEPLMNQVYELCKKHNINHAALFQLDTEGQVTEFADQRTVETDDVSPEIAASVIISEMDSHFAIAVVKAWHKAMNNKSAEMNPHGIVH